MQPAVKVFIDKDSRPNGLYSENDVSRRVLAMLPYNQERSESVVLGLKRRFRDQIYSSSRYRRDRVLLKRGCLQRVDTNREG